MKPIVGVIGLGRIGGSVAKRLINLNYEVVTYDIDEKKTEKLIAFGAASEENISGLVNKVTHLITSLPNDSILNDVLLGKGGVFDSLNSCLSLIELSTVLPETLEEINENGKEKKVEILDCPISGGPLEAIKGELSLIVAGEEDVFQKNLPLLNAIGNQVHYVGRQIGSGKATKLINNIMTMGNVLVAAEAFSLGMGYGLDPEKLFDVLSKTGGRSHHFVKRFPKVITSDYSPWFSMALGKKDLDLAKQWAETNNYTPKVTSFIRDYYEQGTQEGLAEEDIVAIIKLFLN